jgi:hypothetical protein
MAPGNRPPDERGVDVSSKKIGDTRDFGTLGDYGWFVEFLTALEAGDYKGIMVCQDVFSFWQTDETIGEALYRVILTFHEASLGTFTRDQYFSMDHPILGRLDWQLGDNALDLEILVRNRLIVAYVFGKDETILKLVRWTPTQLPDEPEHIREVERLLAERLAMVVV